MAYFSAVILCVDGVVAVATGARLDGGLRWWRGRRGRAGDDECVASGGRGVEGEKLFGGGGLGFRLGRSCGGGGGEDVAIQVGESTGFHRFAAVVTSAWDIGCVDGVFTFIEPFIFSFAAIAGQLASLSMLCETAKKK